MARGLCPPFDLEAYREGHLTPVFFGSALNNFGVRELLRGVAELAPPPRPQPARAARRSRRTRSQVTGFVFKVQANMDPQHRDRIAFVRLCSGRFQRGMKLKNSRTGKAMAVHNPVLFLARERKLAEEAWPGDIIGIPNHGTLRIGDALTEGEDLRFTGIPSFAPEILRRVRIEDPMKPKHLRPRADAARRGGRDPRVQADQRQRLDRRRRRRACSSTCCTARLAGRIRPRRPGSTARPTRRRAGSTATAPSSTASATATPRRWPRTTTASRSSSPATPGICAPRPRNGRRSASARPASSIDVKIRPVRPLDRGSG